ncbi:MAG: 30S ribosomal protein S6 [Patescibacteria group bacterium]
MRKYELAIVLDPDLKEEEKEKLVEEIKAEIEKLKGKVEKVDPWGKKELSYPIKKAKEGIYLIFNLELPGDGTAELGKKLRLKEKVLRYLLVKVE